MLVEIQDDFDLDKIANCGQCFRAKELEGGMYRFITGEDVLYIQKQEKNQYAVSCSRESWQEVWARYFDMERNYRKLREEAAGRNCFVEKAIQCGQGLRVLKQEPWEMLITFIISQRKTIPAIAKSVELLAQKFGHPIQTGREVVWSFPSSKELLGASMEDLAACSLGYRAGYVKDAAEKAAYGELDMEAISGMDDEAMFREIMKVKGVGKKVANCVCLFGYGRLSRVPVDVWIARAIEDGCQGENPFPQYGEYAGIIQQYIFYYGKYRKFG